MTARERILAIRLSEKLGKAPDFAKKVGVRVDFKKVRSDSDSKANLSESYR